MRRVGSPSLRNTSGFVVGSKSDKRLILQDLYLSPVQLLSISAKTITRDSLSTPFTTIAKTITKTAIVTHLLQDIAISSKTISKSSTTIPTATICKTVSKTANVISLLLDIVGSSKTRSITVGVPNLVLALTASAKTVSHVAGAASTTLHVNGVSTTISRASGSVTVSGGGGISLQLSSSTISHCEVVITTLSISQRVNRSRATMISNQIVANLLPGFYQ